MTGIPARALATCLAALHILSPSGVLAVFGGAIVEGQGFPASSVVAITFYKQGPSIEKVLCTGTLIHPRLVLTARHCTFALRGSEFVYFTANMTSKQVESRGVVGVYAGRENRPPTAAELTDNHSRADDPDDLALLLLESDAPESAQIMRLADETTGERTFTTVHIAGYGGTGIDPLTMDTKGWDGVLRTAEVPLVDPTGEAYHLTADQDRGSGICHGDSGGPAWVVVDGVPVIVGVASSVSETAPSAAGCTGTAYFIDVVRWREWIVTASQILLGS